MPNRSVSSWLADLLDGMRRQKDGYDATMERQRYRRGMEAALVVERKFRRINSPELLPAVAAGQQYH